MIALRRYRPELNAFQSGLTFAVCPLPVLVSVYHGQFDTISTFLATAAVFLNVSKRQADRDFSAVALALGFLQKFWPAFLGLVLLAQIRHPRAILRYLAICGGFVVGAILLYVVVFDSSLDVIFDHTVRYSTPYPRAGGFPLVLSRLSLDGLYKWWIDNGLYPTGALVVAVSAFTIVKRAHAFVASVAVLCALFVLVPDGSSYHYVWVLPFGIISSHRLPVAIIALLAAAQYIIVGYIGGSLYYPPFEGPGLTWMLNQYANLMVAVWLTFVAWLAWIVWQLNEGNPEFVQAAADASSAEPSQTPTNAPRS